MVNEIEEQSRKDYLNQLIEDARENRQEIQSLRDQLENDQLNRG